MFSSSGYSSSVRSCCHISVAASSSAYDIKTPPTSVIGYLVPLAEGHDLASDRREHHAAAALEKARWLSAMMDEFFEVSRDNLGTIPIERENADVALLLGLVAGELGPAVAAQDVASAVDAPEGLTAFLDPRRWRACWETSSRARWPTPSRARR